jgi:hypothetical protein
MASTMLRAAKALCSVPLFSATQMQIVGFEAAKVFQLAATLCKGGEEGQDKLDSSHCEG